MKLYELNYLISSNLEDEEKIKIFQEKINSFIQKEQGVLNRIIKPIKKILSYPIKKNNQAYLSTLSFYLNPKNLAHLEKKLKAENNILRYIILTKQPQKITKMKLEKFKKIIKPKPKKVKLEEIEKKLEEILKES